MIKKIMASVLFGTGLIAATSSAVFADGVMFEVKASATISDVLQENTGKRAALKLVSGEEVEGTITQVGSSMVHVSRLAGKEFYDAVVSLDKISAVRMKVCDT